MESKKVGFLGLGNMGFPMARNLLQAGFTVYGVDVNPDNEEKFAEIGGKIGYDASTLPSEVNIILTSLPTPNIVEQVYIGKDGLIESGIEGLILIDLSTISPDLNRQIAKVASEKGIKYLGAPVSGSVSGAEAGTLSVMVGGEKAVFNHANQYFRAIGKNIFHVSEDHGTGTIVKLINNMMAGIHTQAVAESLALADAAGIDHNTVYEIVNVSSGQSDIFTRNYKNFIEQDEYQKGAFYTALLLKDIRLAKEVAHSMDSRLPIGETLVDYLEENIDGYADMDMSCTYQMLTNQAVNS